MIQLLNNEFERNSQYAKITIHDQLEKRKNRIQVLIIHLDKLTEEVLFVDEIQSCAFGDVKLIKDGEVIRKVGRFETLKIKTKDREWRCL